MLHIFSAFSNFFRALSSLAYRTATAEVWIIPGLIWVAFLAIRDIFYTILALLLPLRPVGKVIPPGKPGYRGIWPKWQAPEPTNSRSPCPALNALANHGMLPRDGRHIYYKDMSSAIQHAYNLSPTLADQLTASAYLLDQGRGWINLHDLNVLNVVQHDASFTRPDIAFSADQGYPRPELVERFLKHATNGKSLSIKDFSYFSGLRRAECRASNGQFSLTYSFIHMFFGSGNCALMYSIFGGNVKDLRIWLAEERIPDGWEPRSRYRVGHTILFAQKTTVEVEALINEKQQLRPGDFLLQLRES